MRWVWLVVPLVGLSLAIVVLAATCLVAVKSTVQGTINDSSSSTTGQFAQMHAAIELVRLPAGYRLVRTQQMGAAGILGFDQPPEEVRTYAVTVASPGHTANMLRAAFLAAGFDAQRLFHCSFSATRGPVLDFVEYYKTPSSPAVQSNPQCPKPSWSTVYAYTVLSLRAF